MNIHSAIASYSALTNYNPPRQADSLSDKPEIGVEKVGKSAQTDNTTDQNNGSPKQNFNQRATVLAIDNHQHQQQLIDTYMVITSEAGKDIADTQSTAAIYDLTADLLKTKSLERRLENQATDKQQQQIAVDSRQDPTLIYKTIETYS